MGANETLELGTKVQTDIDYDDAVTRVRKLLAEQGFGILTEIDVKSTLKTKIDAGFRRYIILGACNPALAHRALSKEIDVGLMLPCNVIVYENDDGGSRAAPKLVFGGLSPRPGSTFPSASGPSSSPQTSAPRNTGAGPRT